MNGYKIHCMHQFLLLFSSLVCQRRSAGILNRTVNNNYDSDAESDTV